MAKFDFESLTISEVETIEQISGSPIDSLMDDKALKGKSLKAIVFIIKKRDEPMFTLEDAGKLSFKEAMALLNASEEELDPKD